MLDASHPSFRPLWVRIVVTLVACGWAAFEASDGAYVWALLFGAAGVWCIYALLLTYKDPEDNAEEQS